MDGPRTKSRLAPALIVAGALVLPAYVAGYFAFSTLSDVPGVRLRKFHAEWQAFIYAPAAFLESKITGTPVYNSW